MRGLTLEEKEILDRRRSGFEAFLDERMPVLLDFMQRLELPDPAMVLAEADHFLPALDAWLKNQVIEPADRNWILTRVGYFVGEFLVQRLRGHWFLNDVPDSRYFGHYVVGRFARPVHPNAMVDPFAVAFAYVSEPPGRSLSRLLTDVEKEIVKHEDN